MKNKIVGTLIAATGFLYLGSIFTEVENLSAVAFITGMSAIFTSLLIKEKA